MAGTPDRTTAITAFVAIIGLGCVVFCATLLLQTLYLKWRDWRVWKRLDQQSQAQAQSKAHLPPVIAAHLLDNSDTSDLYPDPERCGECYLLWLHHDYRATARTADGGYVQPLGAARPCAIHQQTPLGAALRRKETAR